MAAVAKATTELAALKKQVSETSTSRDQGNFALTAVQSDVKKAEAALADLRKKEQELALQMATMTTAMNTAATDATKALSNLSKTAASTIQEMAEKAAEVRRAVNEIKVPSLKPEASTLPAKAEDASPTIPEGGNKE